MIPNPQSVRGRLAAAYRLDRPEQVPELRRLHRAAKIREALAAMAAEPPVLTPAERRELAEICRRLLGTTKPAVTDEAA